jgi:hypothetical protein
MATKQSSSYPLPGVTLPNPDYGSYSNPQRGKSITPGAAMVGVLQQGDLLRQKQEAARKEEERKEEIENRRIIENMQTVQTNADLWNLDQMSNLHSLPRSTAIEDQLRATLESRLNIATQANVYLKTQFGDKEKRASAQKAISDYYDLLNLSKDTITNFGALGTYWKEKAPTIGSQITIIGNDENELKNNQYLVNALGGVYDDAKFEMVFDEKNNDIMIKVSGNEHVLDDSGNMVLGDHREKIISARAWNAKVAAGDQDFQFVSDVPQIVNETLDMLKTKELSKNQDGIGVLNNKNNIADIYWEDDIVMQGTIPTSTGGTMRTTSVKRKLNLELLKNDMLGVLRQKVNGVVRTGPQQTANFWNIDLQKLNEGFENSYQKLSPENEVMVDALFDKVVESLTSFDGITTDPGTGDIYHQTDDSISAWPKDTTEKPLDYRVDYMQTIVDPKAANLTNETAVTETLGKFKPNIKLLDKEEIFDIWLEAEHPEFENYTNKEYYETKELDSRAAFNKEFTKDGLYKVKGRSIEGHIGDYDLDRAEDRLNFILDNMDASERKKMENLTNLRALAWASDWYTDHEQIKGVDPETQEEWIKRMKAAYKKAHKKNFPAK